MPRPLTDAQHKALVKRAIAHAESVAADDADFVRRLRAAYFAEHAPARRRLAILSDDAGGAAEVTRAATRRARSADSDPSLHIYDDPRYLQNARVLARRTMSNARIMGGGPVTGTKWNDCVAVGNDTDWACTGTLIAPTVVVTAGHCASFATRVFVGNDVDKKGKVVDVAKRVRHPKYHKGGKHNDLLVLVLAKKVTGATPRRIAPTALIDTATDGRAVGFGNVEATGHYGYGVKRLVDLPVASPSCSGKVNNQQDTTAYGCDRALEMIAGKPLLAKDSCTGDSGGPFYIQDAAGKWLLAGATSRSTAAAMSTCGDGGVYVRVDKYKDWIESVAGVNLP